MITLWSLLRSASVQWEKQKVRMLFVEGYQWLLAGVVLPEHSRCAFLATAMVFADEERSLLLVSGEQCSLIL